MMTFPISMCLRSAAITLQYSNSFSYNVSFSKRNAIFALSKFGVVAAEQAVPILSKLLIESSINKTIIADVFEATVAVIYLEQGISAVKRLFRNLIVPFIKNHEDFLMDYKSLLQESVQTVKKSVTYNLISETGPAHKREFKVEVIIDDLVYGVGVGGSKKEAEQNAAKEAYLKRAK